MAAAILPACRVCGKTCARRESKFCSLACRDSVPKSQPKQRIVEPRIAAFGLSIDDWLDRNYYADGCNLATASALLGLDKRTLWAFLKRTNRIVKPQSVTQIGALNPFFGRTHDTESRAAIGAASKERQPRMRRNKTSQFGDVPPLLGPDSPLFKTGIKAYRRLALAAYGMTCSLCGKTGTGRQIDVHHRDGNRKNNDLSNLVVMCRGCHIRTHRSPR